MKTTKKIDPIVALATIAAILIIVTASCKKQLVESVFSSPWKLRSSGINAPERAIIEMSEPDQITCYGLIVLFRFISFSPLIYFRQSGRTLPVLTQPKP